MLCKFLGSFFKLLFFIYAYTFATSYPLFIPCDDKLESHFMLKIIYFHSLKNNNTFITKADFYASIFC